MQNVQKAENSLQCISHRLTHCLVASVGFWIPPDKDDISKPIFSLTYIPFIYIYIYYWDLVFVDTVRPLCAGKAWSHMFPLSWRKLETPASESPKGSAGGLKLTQRCDNLTGESRVNHYWSLWAPWPVKSSFLYNACSPAPHSLFIHLLERSRPLFPSNSLEEKAVGPSTDSSLREELAAARSLFQFNPTSWRRVAASSSSHQGNLLAIQALQTEQRWRPAGELQKATELQSPTEPRRTEPHYQQDNFTELQRHSKLFFPFSPTVTQLGLL